MLKITATWKKNMFQFNTVEWVGSRQPPLTMSPSCCCGVGMGVSQNPAEQGDRHGNGASSPGSSHSGNGPTGPSRGGTDWPWHRAAQAHPWAS